MKQHITVNQMKEVKDKELAKYMSLHFTHLLEAVCYYGADSPLGRDKLSEMSRMITIGKMIEILENKGYNYIEFCKQESPYKAYKEYVGVGIYSEAEIIENFGETKCDALWEAVKYLLNEKKNEA